MQSGSEKMNFHIGDIKTIKSMPDQPAGEPFSDDRIEFLNEISKKLRTDKNAKNHPDVMTFAFWIRKANMEKKKMKFNSNIRVRAGRGIVFHIAPSNVAVNYAYSFAVGFICGNANIVRLPSRNFPQIDIINKAILAVLNEGYFDKKWGQSLVFLRYGKSKEINDYFSSICDVRIIWGGDASIREIRKSELPPRSGEITFADRFSICVLQAEEYMAVSDKEKFALDFYNDTYLSDQNACTSPKLVCWMGGCEEIRQAKAIFWDKLWNVVLNKYTFQPVQYIDKLANCCLSAAAIAGIHIDKMKDNLITKVTLDQLHPLLLEYWGNSGFFYEYDLKDIMELAPLCGTKLQTISFLGDHKKLVPLINSGVRGIDRIVVPGSTMNFDTIWDGYDLTERLTREIYGFRP